jgi:hypothetical protein
MAVSTGGASRSTGASSGSTNASAGGTNENSEASTAQLSRDGISSHDPSSIHSENGFGSSSKVPGVSPAAALTGAGVPAAHTAGSSLPTYLLLALIGLSAVAVGVVSSGRAGS